MEFEKIGSEMLLNTGAHRPSVSTLAGGGYVVTWYSSGIKAQIYAASGAKVGGVIAVTSSNSNQTVIPIGDDGGFLVSWFEYSTKQVRGQIFDSAGTKVGSELLIKALPSPFVFSEDQDIAALPNGGFVLTWQGYNEAGRYNITAQTFDAAGAPASAEFFVSSPSSFAIDEGQPSVAAVGTDRFVVAWYDHERDPNGGPPRLNPSQGQIFDLAGNKVGSPFLIGTRGNEDVSSSMPDVVALVGGGFIVSYWHHFPPPAGPGSFHLVADIFDGAGNKVRGLIFLGNQDDGPLSISPLPDGGFLALRSGDSGTGSEVDEIVGQFYDAGGERVGQSFFVNDTIPNGQYGPQSVMLPNGTVVVVWSDSGPVAHLGNDDTVRAQLIADPFDGTEGDDVIVGGGGDDVFRGLGGNDNIAGGSGADRIEGGAGNDYLQGDAGANFMNGGDGNDSLNGGSDGETLHGGTGNDTILGNGGNDEMDGGDGDDVLVGGDGNDAMAGGAGADQLTGGTGDDLLNGGAGGDYMHGGTGNDIFYFDDQGDDSFEGAGEGTDLVRTTINHNMRPNVENAAFVGAGFVYIQGNELTNLIDVAAASEALVVANEGDDVVTGGIGNDNIAGGLGNDTLNGGGGDDYLQGDAGANVLNGGAGNDGLNGGDDAETLNGGTGNDILLGNGGNDQIDGGDGDDRLVGGDGNDNMLGGAGVDQLTGGTGDDLLNGAAGGDYMHGGLGNDIFYFDHAGDDSVEGAGEGTDLARTTINHNLRPNVENVTFIGTGSVYIQGNELGNVIDATASSQALVVAGDGNDIVTGGTGNDNIAGGAGDDVLSGGLGADYLQGDAGANILDGGAGNDSLNGGEDAETLYGGTGNDNMLGNGGSDRLEGGVGDDAVNGGAGDDLLFGQAGADTIHGGAGGDSLHGGAGSDYLEGGAGADRYVYESDALGGFTDTIQGFSKAEGDRVDLSAVDADSTTAGDQAFTYIGSGQFSGKAGELRIAANPYGQYIVQADVNGDGIADLDLFFLSPTQPIDQGDFIF